jgi:hypothetical protein
MEYLHFVFSDFWHFVGTLLLVGVVAEGLGRVVRR